MSTATTNSMHDTNNVGNRGTSPVRVYSQSIGAKSAAPAIINKSEIIVKNLSGL